MIRSIYTLGLLALLPALAQAQSPVFSKTTKGTPDIKSIQALGFAPGALLIGDGRGGSGLRRQGCQPASREVDRLRIARPQGQVG